MEKPVHLEQLKEWLESYRPEELFDENGRLKPEIAELTPKGNARMGANPHANGGLLLKDLRLPDFRDYGIEVEAGKTKAQDMIELGGTGTHLTRMRPTRMHLTRTRILTAQTTATTTS